MKLLALETATEACSAALLIDGAVTQRLRVEPRAHGRLILGMVDELLAEAGITLTQLDALAFGRGPGAFTGLRIATGVVQGLAFGADRPVVPVSTLAALAQGTARVHAVTRVLAALDARMGEVYWGTYESAADGLMRETAAERVGSSATVPPPPGAGWFGAGSGFAACAAALQERLGQALAGQDAALLPQAQDVAVLAAAVWAQGGGVSAEQAQPVYLRDEVVQHP